MTIEELKALLAKPTLIKHEKDGPGPWDCWRCGNDIRGDFPGPSDGRGNEEPDIVAAYDWLMSEGNICSWCYHQLGKD